MTSWIKRYETKKKSSKQRGIEFSLTKEEFMNLHKMATVCDYTGIAFDNGLHQKSIERIDDTKGYHTWNTCVVSARVNVLKDSFVDKMKKCSLLPEELPLLEKIRHTLNTKTPEQLTAKYRITGETKMNQESIVNKPSNSDITLAQAYVKFAEGKKEMQLSFPEFKKLYVRKTCAVTGKTFSRSHELTKKQIVRIDTSKGWTSDNVRALTLFAHGMLSEGLFSKKEITKLVDAM